MAQNNSPDRKIEVCNLPVMKAHCKTCPFKPDKDEKFQNIALASEVIRFTYMQGQHVCHSTDLGIIDSPQHRCRGSFNYFKELYTNMGIGWMIQEEPITLEELCKKHNINFQKINLYGTTN